jgi:GAF domain
VQLVTIARLTVERVTAARYASVTALRGKTYTTVAVSDDLIRAIDDVQYADDAGPCLDALRRSTPVGVPDIDTTLQWPGFHEAAPRMGLHASVSVPLFAGRGDAIATLNVYGHDRVAMAPLIAGISLVHLDPGPEATDGGQLSELDADSRELVVGYAEALSIRDTVRLAIELIRTSNRCSTDDAYLSLCIRAGDAGTDLAEAATALISRSIDPP